MEKNRNNFEPRVVECSANWLKLDFAITFDVCYMTNKPTDNYSIINPPNDQMKIPLTQHF